MSVLRSGARRRDDRPDASARLIDALVEIHGLGSRGPVRHHEPQAEQMPLSRGVRIIDVVGARVKNGPVAQELNITRAEIHVEEYSGPIGDFLDERKRLLLEGRERIALLCRL